MFFNIIILLNAGLLNAIDSSLFVKEEVPVANLNLVEEQDFVQSAFICSLKFLGKKAEGGDCQVFNYVNTTESCFLGSFSENDKSDKDNSTQLVWKQRGCPVPEDPEHGRWNCLKNIKQEKCFLVCSPGYVAQSYRGLYCNHGANAEWDKPLDEFKCLPTIIAVTGGLLSPTNKQFYTFGPNGQRLYTQGITQQTRQHVVQYFSGKITYCGGDPKAGWINTGCYYYDFDLGGQKSEVTLQERRQESTSVIVQDRYYMIGGSDIGSRRTAEYLLEGDLVSKVGMATPEWNDFSCAIRFSDRSFIVIGKDIVTEYDIISGIGKDLPKLNIPRQKFGCSSFLDVDGEEVFIVAGGNSAGSKRSTEIFKPSVGTWTVIGELNYERNSHAVVTTSDGVYAIGNKLNNKEKVEKLDIETKTWNDTGLFFQASHTFANAITAIPISILPP